MNHPGQCLVTQAYLLFKGQCWCVFVWVFSIAIQTDGWIRMKFGTKVVLEGGRFLGGGFDPIPYQTKPYVKILI